MRDASGCSTQRIHGHPDASRFMHHDPAHSIITYTVAMTNRCVSGLNGNRVNGGDDAESTGLPDAGFVNSDCSCFNTSITPISILMTYLDDRIRSCKL